MMIPNQGMAAQDPPETPAAAAVVEAAPEPNRQTIGRKAKLFPDKLQSRSGRNQQKPDDEFTGRIQSLCLKGRTSENHEAVVSIGSKKGKSRTYVLNDCSVGLEKDCLKLLMSSLAAKWKVTLKTSQAGGMQPRIVEIRVHK